jgi:vacuolar-type H+-ATPase subunit E/Vma4
MSDEQFNPDITKKIEANTDKIIQEIVAGQKEEIKKIKKETNEKIKQLTETIIEEAKTRAEAEFQKEKAKQELDLRLKITKFRDELVGEFIKKSTKKIVSITKTKEYENSLAKLIEEAIITLKEPELKLYYRREDKSILTKQFLDKITGKLKKDRKITVKLIVSDSYIKGIGGVIIETSDGKISINNTYEKRIERSLEELRRELSSILIQEGE